MGTIDGKAVQQRLTDAGYYHAAIDGAFGRRSYAALFSAVARRDLGDVGLAIGDGCVASMRAAGIDQPLRLAHFIAQTATETGGFATLEENLSYSAKRLMAVWPGRFPTLASTDGLALNPVALANKVYGGRLGNGPAASGDGYRYRGRGLIQLTGRANYAAREAETGILLVTHPELASDPATAVRIACLYWQSRSINLAADEDDLAKVRAAVNGGAIGIDDARQSLKRAKAMIM